jgi:hypothetical protein
MQCGNSADWNCRVSIWERVKLIAISISVALTTVGWGISKWEDRLSWWPLSFFVEVAPEMLRNSLIGLSLRKHLPAAALVLAAR